MAGSALDHSIDAFLELKQEGGARILGETQDGDFAEKNAIELLDFSMKLGEHAHEDEEPELVAEQKVTTSSKLPAKLGDRGVPKFSQNVRTTLKSKKKRKRDDSHPYSFEVTKLVDSSSSQLFYLYCQYKQRPVDGSGQPVEDPSATIKEAQISFRKGGGQLFKYMRLYFEDLLVIDYSLKVDGSHGHSIEELTFSFDKCEITYDTQAASGAKATDPGKVLRGWDFGENEPWAHKPGRGQDEW